MTAESTPAAPLPPAGSSRIDLIDALRGSALIGLFLVHAVEHFDFFRYPPNPPAWLAALNRQTADITFFLFSGKAWAIFAMMFGLSFFIIIDRAAQRGVDFRTRFLWRLVVLGVIGYLLGLIYCGEILTMLAVLGMPLVFFYKMSTRSLLWISALLLLQLPFLWQLINTALDPAYTPFQFGNPALGRQMRTVFANEGFLAVCNVNAWTSLYARSAWAIDNGRCLQMVGLFIWGLLLGRSRLFEQPALLMSLARRALAVGAVAFVIFYWARAAYPSWELSKTQNLILKRLFSSHLNLAQMTIWAAGFVLLYQYARIRDIFNLLVPFGRTSLTCYAAQNVIGVVLFYHFGAGLFRHWGQFYSILYGIVFVIIQCAFTHLWLRYFNFGPLEWLWRSLTMLSFRTPLRKRAPAVISA